MVRLLRNLSFGLLGLITLALAAATVVEKTCGPALAFGWFYHSPVMLALWGVMAVTGAGYLYTRRRRLSLGPMLIHVALAIILAGAAVSFATSQRGTLTLETGAAPVGTFTTDGGARSCALPFTVALKDCGIDYNPGTTTPMDYHSTILIDNREHVVSMNNVASVDGYRFYQTAIGPDRSTLSVAHDPAGITLSYTGYALLLVGMCLFFFSRPSGFRTLWRRVAVGALMGCAALPAAASDATPMPRTLQRPLAASFGRLFIYRDGRVMPMQTFAREFCLKLTGSDSYRGLTPEQVLTGWIFYYDDWKTEPMIKIKGEKVKQLLGTDDSRVSLVDFHRGGVYALDRSLKDVGQTDRDIAAADEKVMLISAVVTGTSLTIIPVASAGGGVEWYSWGGQLPPGVDPAYAMAVNSRVEALWHDIAHGRYNSANRAIGAIGELQRQQIPAGALPSGARFDAELLYNRVSMPWPRAVAVLALAVASFIFARRRWVAPALTALTLLYLTFLLALQWIVSGHIPMSNGYETMQTMAWLSLAAGLALGRRLPMLCPLTLLVAAMALMVAAMGESNPSMSPLLPVLSSPFLSIHVMMVMLAYAIFTMMALISVISFFRDADARRRLADISTLLLYPGVFALGAGIFVGAVWANISWGRYWGWDPKETWALITFFIYALPLHRASFARLNRPGTLHLYYFVAFLSVIVTYFGVNYLLTGLHSYATA